MAMRIDQAFLDGDLGDLRAVVFRGRLAAKFGQQHARAINIAGTQRFDDLGEGMAELAESHCQIQHRDVPDPGRGKADVEQEIVNRHRYQHPGQHGQQPGDHALILLAGIEMIAQRVDVAQIRAMGRIARGERPGLLDQEGKQNGKKGHCVIRSSIQPASYRIAARRPEPAPDAAA